METPDKGFCDLCNSIYTEMYNYVEKMSFNKNIVEDILQDTFFEIYKNIVMISNLDEDSQRAYIYTVAKKWVYKLSKREFKHQKGRITFDVEDENRYEDFVIEDDFTDELIDELTLKQYLDELSENERELLDLHYCQGFNLKEIAKMQNTTEGNVKVRLCRIRQKIKLKYEKDTIKD